MCAQHFNSNRKQLCDLLTEETVFIQTVGTGPGSGFSQRSRLLHGGSGSVTPVLNFPLQSSHIRSGAVLSISHDLLHHNLSFKIPLMSCSFIPCPHMSCPLLSCSLLSCPVLSRTLLSCVCLVVVMHFRSKKNSSFVVAVLTCALG